MGFIIIYLDLAAWQFTPHIFLSEMKKREQQKRNCGQCDFCVQGCDADETYEDHKNSHEQNSNGGKTAIWFLLEQCGQNQYLSAKRHCDKGMHEGIGSVRWFGKYAIFQLEHETAIVLAPLQVYNEKGDDYPNIQKPLSGGHWFLSSAYFLRINKVVFQ